MGGAYVMSLPCVNALSLTIVQELPKKRVVEMMSNRVYRRRVYFTLEAWVAIRYDVDTNFFKPWRRDAGKIADSK